MVSTLRALFNILSSTTLAIILFAILALFCIAGTFLDMESAVQFMYHAPWFIAASGLFSLNLVLCSIKRSRKGRRWPVGFLMLHLGVFVVVTAAALGYSTMEEGIMEVFQGKSGQAIWKVTSRKMPDSKDLRLLVRRGQTVEEGVELAKLGDRLWTHEGPPCKVEGFHRDRKGDVVISLRRKSGDLPFSIHLERFWIEYYPLSDGLPSLIVSKPGHSTEPEILEPTLGLQGESDGARWKIDKIEPKARRIFQRDGPHVVIVKSSKAQPIAVLVEEGKETEVPSHGVFVRPRKFFLNGKLDGTRGNWRIVEGTGDGYNPAAEVEVTLTDGTKEMRRLFSAMPSMSEPGTDPHRKARQAVEVDYRAPKTKLSVEPGGDTYAVHVSSEKNGQIRDAWLFPNSGEKPFRVGTNLLLRLTDMRRPMPKSYKSKVSLVQNGEVVRSGIIEVNHPLQHDGYWIYQQGYDQRNEQYSVLNVVRDPWIWPSFAGLALLIIGAFWLLYVEPLVRWSRRTGEVA